MFQYKCLNEKPIYIYNCYSCNGFQTNVSNTLFPNRIPSGVRRRYMFEMSIMPCAFNVFNNRGSCQDDNYHEIQNYNCFLHLLFKRRKATVII